jgi:hypothetical protein
MKYSCRVVVRGRLGREWTRLLDGWRITPQRDGTTLLEGTAMDEMSVQALLGGLRPRQLAYARCVHLESEHASAKVAAVSTGVR